MTQVTCQNSGEKFTVSSLEKELRAKFGFGDTLPTKSPKYRFQELGAFWPHWNLHPRKCDKTGKTIISIFRSDCVYPVWDREEWIKYADPPMAELDFTQNFFEQAWELFQRCPIPHNFQSHNQNCEYTDDWYRSKNCYLCHSGQDNEDCRYCYGCDKIKDCGYSVVSMESALCNDLVNCKRCFDSNYLLYCRNVNNSDFLYDCRNCSDCMFCFNLRNKKYCFGNQELTKDEFEKRKKEWNLTSRERYEQAKTFFGEMMKTQAWHRCADVNKQEDSFGNYIENVKKCENCYFLTKHEDCVNVLFCGPDAKSFVDSLGTVGAELGISSVLPVYSYEVRFSFSVNDCKFTDYSAYCFQCSDCFGCCGLVGKKYCIFNKQYTKEEYAVLKEKIIKHMEQSEEWGKMFPGYFAPNPYDESLSGYHFPISSEQQKQLRFRDSKTVERKPTNALSISDIPDSYSDEDFEGKVFWDEIAQRPFQIPKEDIQFSGKLKCPLPNSYYMRRIQENFDWMPFSGSLRRTKCAKSGKHIETSWPEEYDGRILSEEEYLKVI